MTYVGTTGTIGGVHVPAGSADQLTMRSGTRVELVATADVTEGGYGIFRWHLVPSMHGPDPHFHKTFSESFYVLSGTVGLYDGQNWVDATAGDFLYIPAGGIHAYRPANDQPATMLTLFSPGMHREKYFAEMAEIAESGRQLSKDEWDDLFRRHDQYWA